MALGGDGSYGGNAGAMGGCGVCTESTVLSAVTGIFNSPIDSLKYQGSSLTSFKGFSTEGDIIRTIEGFNNTTGDNLIAQCGNGGGIVSYEGSGVTAAYPEGTNQFDYINSVLDSGGAIAANNTIQYQSGKHWNAILDCRETTNEKGETVREYLVVDSYPGLTVIGDGSTGADWKSEANISQSMQSFVSVYDDNSSSSSTVIATPLAYISGGDAPQSSTPDYSQYYDGTGNAWTVSVDQMVEINSQNSASTNVTMPEVDMASIDESLREV